MEFKIDDNIINSQDITSFKKESTFDRIKILQILIKKENFLKEQCK